MIHRKFHDGVASFKDRISGLYLYVKDDKFLLFCLVYFLFNFVELYVRNIDFSIVIGLLSFFFLFLVICTYRTKGEKSNYETNEKNFDCRKKLFNKDVLRSAWVVICAAIVCVSIRSVVFIKKEISAVNTVESFTDEYTCFLVDISEGGEDGESTDGYYSTLLSVYDLETSFSPFKILFKYPNYRKLKVGDRYKICGTISEPEIFEDFDYKKFLMNRKVYGILEVYSLEFMERKISLKSILYDFKIFLVQKAESLMTELQVSLLIGILIGENRMFSEEFEENLRKSGTSHIVAASGYNITILIILVEKVFKGLGKRSRNILSILVIWCFCVISGLSASILRAGIIGTLNLISGLFGRYKSIHRIFVIGIWIFVFASPVVFFNTGFQLSVTATLGLMYFSPALENALKKKFKIGNFFKEYLLTTMSCTLCTLPVTISTFGTFSIVGILANCLILPVLESTMLWGSLGLLISFFSKKVSQLFLTISFLQLKYFEKVVNFLGSLKISSFTIEGSLGVLISCFVGIFLIVFVITNYPVENETNNYYLKSAKGEYV